MGFRALKVVFILFWCTIPVFAQTATSAPQRSHVERFSSTEVRAERTEADATFRLTADPNDVDALNKRAYARMNLGRYQEAHEDLRRAVALNPKNAEFQAGLGYTLWKIGRHKEAIAAERAAINLDENNFTAHYQLGRFLLFSAGNNRQQLTDASTHLRRALQIDPRHTEVRFDLLTAYRALGDAAQAFAQLKLLEDAKPGDVRVTYIDALLAADRGDMNAAINGFREALRQDPTLFGAWQDLGLAYVRLGRWKDAVETFGELSKRHSDAVVVAFFYEFSLFISGNIAEAVREVRRALRIVSFAI
jgi:Flp pilus assembly protein TadD